MSLSMYQASVPVYIRMLTNLIAIMEKTTVKRMVLDHHLLREVQWKNRVISVFSKARTRGVELMTAAEFIGLKTDLLEARRRELYEN